VKKIKKHLQRTHQPLRALRFLLQKKHQLMLHLLRVELNQLLKEVSHQLKEVSLRPMEVRQLPLMVVVTNQKLKERKAQPARKRKNRRSLTIRQMQVSLNNFERLIVF
jgi:hypothetical protein